MKEKKRKHILKFFFTIFTVILFTAVMRSTAYAASGTCGETSWSLDNGVLTVSGSGAMADYIATSPNTVPWFSLRSQINKVVIGNGVTHIGDYVFYYNENLSSLELGTGVTTIGECAFLGTKLSSISLPTSIMEIESGAFYTASMTTARVPASCIMPADYDRGVFCDAVVTFYGTCGTDMSFELNTSADLLTLTGTGPMAEFEVVNDMIVTPWSKFSYDVRTIQIGDGITSISMGAFCNCDLLGSVSFGSGLQTIGGMAFAASGLTSITIPGNVTSIEDYAFFSCSSLTNIQLTEGLQTIGDAAFASCAAGSVVIPSSVTSIGGSAFWEIIPSTCYNLSNASLDINYMHDGSSIYSPLTVGPGMTITCGDTKSYNSNTLYSSGSTVTLTPDSNLIISDVAVNNVPIAETVGTYGFTMPDRASSVTFTSAEITPTPEVTDPLDTNLKFKAASLTLEGDISINYYIAKSALDGYDSFYVHFVKDVNDGSSIKQTSDVSTYTLSTIDGIQCYVFSFNGIAAKEMNDMVSATIYASKNITQYYGNSLPYSVANYAYSILSYSTSDTLKTAIVDMLNYGSDAQTYFGYNTANLVNSTLSEAQMQLATSEVPTLANNSSYIKQDSDAVNFHSVSLVLENKVLLKYYLDLGSYTGDREALTLAITYQDANGLNVTKTYSGSEWTLQDGYYTKEFTELAAKDMSIVCTAVVYENYGTVNQTTVSSPLQYSIETYAYNQVLNSSNTNLVKLLNDMMKYSNSLKTYFINK
ncbi:MAG: leucine-rich repeat domain-containing protein [Herbinix sp.]|nr:leucine-rich repeat domain-containing protein [Herbinix sp.]